MYKNKASSSSSLAFIKPQLQLSYNKTHAVTVTLIMPDS